MLIKHLIKKMWKKFQKSKIPEESNVSRIKRISNQLSIADIIEIIQYKYLSNSKIIEMENMINNIRELGGGEYDVQECVDKYNLTPIDYATCMLKRSIDEIITDLIEDSEGDDIQ